MSIAIYPEPQECVWGNLIQKPESVSLHFVRQEEKAECGRDAAFVPEVPEEQREWLVHIWQDRLEQEGDCKAAGNRPGASENGRGGKVERQLSAVWAPVLPVQGYRLLLSEDTFCLQYGDVYGLYYGLLTFFQIWENSGPEMFQEADIKDFPGILNRGVLLDISRDKIPSVITLFHIIDLLSQCRINEIQLYIQGYSYEYKGYEYMFPDETPITKEEMQQLADYAKSRFITPIPNMNCLGHMDMWLERPELKELAECPDGFSFHGLYLRQPGTTDPEDPEAFAFITGLTEDLLDCFENGKPGPDLERSPAAGKGNAPYIGKFNANLDEPFELGLGKNKEMARERGKATVYMEYVKRLNDHINARGYQMMMWGDVVYSHPEVIPMIPKNAVLMDWIYEGSATFMEHARLMEEKGIDFYVCPGTSSWCSLLGRSDNMKANILDAARAAITYHGKGITVTDWGDLGHWQYLPVSYLGYAFTGAYGWNPKTEEKAVFRFLDKNIFHDPTGRFAKLLYDLGNYYLQEDVVLFNTTFCFANITGKYQFASLEEYREKMRMLEVLTERIAEENHISYDGFHDRMQKDKVVRYVQDVLKEIEQVPLMAQDSDLILAEIRNGVRMVCHGARLHHVMTQLYEAAPDEARWEFAALYDDMMEIMKIHYDLWIRRNKKGGFARSCGQMLHLCKFYRKEQADIKRIRTKE